MTKTRLTSLEAKQLLKKAKEPSFEYSKEIEKAVDFCLSQVENNCKKGIPITTIAMYDILHVCGMNFAFYVSCDNTIFNSQRFAYGILSSLIDDGWDACTIGCGNLMYEDFSLPLSYLHQMKINYKTIYNAVFIEIEV